MKHDGMKGMSLLVMLGFVLSVLTVFAPAGAADGRAGNFELNVKFSDDMGGTTNQSNAAANVNITVNVSIATGMENVTELKLMLDIDSGGIQAEETLGALNLSEFKTHTFEWMPVVYGDHTIVITAVNGTETENQTTTTLYYRALRSDITIQSVELTSQSALIGVDEVTVTAALANAGNAPGTASVTFDVDGLPMGTVDQDVPAGGNANAVFMTDFSGFNLSDGDHMISAMMTDWQDSEVKAARNITLTKPAAKLAVDTLLASAASALEGTNITLTARINNTGTDNAVNQTVDFMDGPTVLHSETNVSLDMDQTKDIPYIWVLPDVAVDTNKTITARLGGSTASVNVTIIAKVARIEITDFNVPEIMRIGDMKTFSATVKNNGTGDAAGIVVEFYDGTAKLAASPAFNLSAGSSTVVPLSVNLTGAPDADHTFFVKVMGVEKNLTRKVAHKLSPAKVGITAFTVKPPKKDKQPQDSTQGYTLTITLKNSGEVKSANCTLTIKEGSKAIGSELITVEGNGTFTKTYTWKVRGSGSHTATATLTGADSGTPATKTTKCTLEYTPGFEVLFLVAAIIAAAALVRRRKN